MLAKKIASNFIRRPLHQHTENIDLQRAIDRAEKQADSSGMNMNVVKIEAETESGGELRILSDFQLKAITSGTNPTKLKALYSTDKGYAVPGM